MRILAISDQPDTLTGLRLAGIEGVLAQSAATFGQAFEQALAAPDVGVLLLRHAEQTQALAIHAERAIPLVLGL